MSIEINTDRCTGCSYCQVTCPSQAITIEVGQRVQPKIDTAKCILCGDCIYICPNNVFNSPELAAQPVPLLPGYDAIIIGAGIGGLMAAAGLARAKKKVLVIEQLSFIGGKYTQLQYQGYAISTAAWTCPGPNSRIGRLCTQLGADIQWVTVHDVKARGDHWIVTQDGRRFTSTDEAQETLAGGPAGMANVYRWISDMYNPNAKYPDDMTARQYIQKFIPNNPAYEDYVQTIITYCFASQTVDTFSAMETKRAIVDAIEQMKVWGTAVGGTTAIVAGLEKVITQNGGEIALRTRVDKINIQNGKAVGVTLSDGRNIQSDVVVHDAGLNRLIQLAGKENLSAEYVQRLHSAVPAIVAAIILGTNESLLGDTHSLLHTMGWQRTLNCYAPTFFDPKLAPSGKHALDVFWVMEPPYDFREELDKVLDELRQIFPNFDQTVDMMVPMFFSGMWTAEMAHRLGQSGDQRLDPKSPIDGLYLVGYDCIGYGMAGDIIPHGVQRALYLILGDPQYAPEEQKASTHFNHWIKSQLFKFMALVKSYTK